MNIVRLQAQITETYFLSEKCRHYRNQCKSRYYKAARTITVTQKSSLADAIVHPVDLKLYHDPWVARGYFVILTHRTFYKLLVHCTMTSKPTPYNFLIKRLDEAFREDSIFICCTRNSATGTSASERRHFSNYKLYKNQLYHNIFIK
jgi:hypothetical protein